MKLFTIVGARPQFIKAAVVSRALRQYPYVRESIVHTGQHHDANMSDVFFEEMDIPRPSYHLGIFGKHHGAMTGEMMEALEKLLLEQQPDLVLVYGDTNSTLAGALAAVKLHIPVAHVEAGLRSFNMRMPEEINRILTDRISNFLFCPTQTAVAHLTREGYPFPGMHVELTGDVMQDAAMYYAQTSAEKSGIIRRLGVQDFILCTLHRAENTDHPEQLKSIVAALTTIHQECPVVLPLHPRTRKVIAQMGLSLPFMVLDPVGYFDMLELLKHCRLVMTDSGGLQKEAYFFQRHCITLREETEWTELIAGGYNLLAGSDPVQILAAWETMKFKKSAFETDLYGGGNAAERIVNRLTGA